MLWSRIPGPIRNILFICGLFEPRLTNRRSFGYVGEGGSPCIPQRARHTSAVTSVNWLSRRHVSARAYGAHDATSRVRRDRYGCPLMVDERWVMMLGKSAELT